MRQIVIILILLGLMTALSSQLDVCKAFYLRDILELTYTIKRNPNDTQAYYNRAVILRECADRKGAISDFTQVIRITPHEANAFYQRGRERHRLGDNQGAITDYQKAGDVYRRQGNLDHHQRTLDNIKQIQRSSPPAL